MSDRDELAALIDRYISDNPSRADSLDAADAILAAGWRKIRALSEVLDEMADEMRPEMPAEERAELKERVGQLLDKQQAFLDRYGDD